MMNMINNLLSVSGEVSGSLADQSVNPVVGSIVMVGAFTVVVVIFAAFLSIVRKNKNQYK
jgi:hypothetical protein